MSSHMRDVAACLAARYGIVGVDVTAGGAGDNTEANTGWIDRLGFYSAKVVIGYLGTITNADTIAIAANLQDASDSAGTGAADYGDALVSTVQATASVSPTESLSGVVELDFDLTGADRWIRAQFTPNLSAAGTDTAEFACLVILGGEDAPPSTARAN